MQAVIHCRYDQLVDPKELKEYEKNPNKHGDDQISRLAKIFEYQGIRHPIVVCKDRGVIASGHGRRLAAIRAGIKEVPVVYQKFDNDDMFYSFVVSDNALSDWSELDLSSINAMVPEFSGDFNLDFLGMKNFTLDFSEKEIENKSQELTADQFDNFAHQCPKCGFEWDEND